VLREYHLRSLRCATDSRRDGLSSRIPAEKAPTSGDVDPPHPEIRPVALNDEVQLSSPADHAPFGDIIHESIPFLLKEDRGWSTVDAVKAAAEKRRP
jgi:hypothetical protein